VRPQDADGGDGLQIWRATANILNKQSRTADKRWSSSLGAGRAAKKSSPTKILFFMECYIGPRTFTDSLDKRPKLKERKQAKLQLLQDPSEINGNNLNNIRREANGYLRNKTREYMKDKLMNLQRTVRTRTLIINRDLYRGINDFKKAYQPRSNLVNDANHDLLADSHNILNRWKNYFSQLLNVYRISGVTQIEYIQLSR
jgi:hypothetical protein